MAYVHCPKMPRYMEVMLCRRKRKDSLVTGLTVRRDYYYVGPVDRTGYFTSNEKIFCVFLEFLFALNTLGYQQCQVAIILAYCTRL